MRGVLRRILFWSECLIGGVFTHVMRWGRNEECVEGGCGDFYYVASG